MTKDAVSFKRESCAERVQWVASWLDFANSSAVPRYRGDFFGSGGSMAQGKERADELVFAQGLAESREMAKRLIMAGKVALEDVSGVRQKVDKPGHKYPLDTAFALVGIEKYVSRGAYKLLTAIEHFKLDVTGFVCLDAGASTGGFTDCMLQNGAKKVYSVDVGYGQFAWKLRQDPRVVCMEKTNIRYVTPEDIDDVLDFASVDVSFISLTKVLPAAYALLKDGGQMVCLIKPQFEAGREKVGKKGVVREKSTHIEVIEMVKDYALSIGFDILNLDFSPIRGPEGNIEYLIHLEKSDAETGQITGYADTEKTVDDAFNTLAK